VLVLDASIVVVACTTDAGFARYESQPLCAPALMWSEARSSLREAVWRGELSAEDGREFLERLESAPVERAAHARLGPEAWRMAEQLGWAKTYDAEYLALATLLGCRFVTLDGRLYRRTVHLGFVVSPAEL